MTTYSYVAVDAIGKEHKGLLEAVDLDQAISLLKQDGKIPVDIGEASGLNRDMKLFSFEKRPKSRDLAVFCRQFVSITAAGVPVTTALEMLSEQTENRMLAEACMECCIGIRSGTSLSESMAENPKVFPQLLVTMVTAGEVSGSLETSFARMAVQFEKEARLKSLVRRSSIYPIAIVVVATIVVMILLAFVIPQFEQMFEDMNTELPLLTKVVVAAGDFVQVYWYVVIIVLVLLVLGIMRFIKTDRGAIVFSRLQLKLPLFGILAVKTASARMSRTLSTLIAAGIPIIDAIDIVANTMTNVLFYDALMASKEEVSVGTPLSEPLVKSGIFPPLVCHMTKIGEETGDMEGMLTKLADYYDEEVEVTTAALMAAMEPAIIVVLALIIGTIVGAVMLPMVDMYSGLGNL